MFNGSTQACSLLNVAIPPADQNNVVGPTTLNPYPLGRGDSGKTVHNLTATGSITVNLPSDANIEDTFEFAEFTAQNIVIDPTANNGGASGTNATGIITDGASSSTLATGKYTSSAIGSSCKLVCVAAGPTWQVVRKQGTWATS